MEKFVRKWKTYRWFLLIPLLITATLIYMFTGASGAAEVMEDPDEGMTETFMEEETPALPAAEIYVDVGGAVASPGVVVLPEGSRIFQALEAAGGVLSQGVTRYLNLAAVCEDGGKIYVPEEAELEEADSGFGQTAAGQTGLMGQDPGISASGQTSEKVNINLADSAALQTLSGIGPSMAQRIIDYRNQNGKFSEAHDLTKVSGIGEKTLNKIIDKICV